MTRSRSTTLEQAILDETRRVLLSEGHTQLSMRRIASAVGCTATSIYLYFNNKDALIHALIDEGMEKLYGELQAAVEGVDDPAERLERLCRTYVGFGLENAEYYEVMFMLHPKQMERYPAEKYRKARRNLDIFGEAMAAILGEQEGARRDLKIAATVIWSSLHGTVSLQIAQRTDVSIPQADLIEEAVRHAMQIVDRLPAPAPKPPEAR